jgi:hypothetical protein
MKPTEIKYQITIDPHSQFKKPSKTEMGRISNNIVVQTGLTITEFSSMLVPPYSYTWFGGTLGGSIKNVNWQQQSIIALDFDKGLIPIEKVIEKLKKEELPPQLWYSSLSDTPELRKFRVVLLLDNPIKSIKHFDIIIQGLLSMFPEADQSCKNPSRFFLGGKNVTILDAEPISTQTLLDKASLILINNDGGRNRKIPVDLLSSSTYSGQKQLFLYSSNRNNHFSPETTYKHTTTTNGRSQSVINWTIARKKIKILDAFLNGEWLYHNQLFGLATNMIYIKGGKKLMLDTMEKFNSLGTTSYTDNNFNIFTYLKKVNYPSIPIYQYTTYPEDLDLHDIVSAVVDQRGHVEITSQTESIDLDVATNLMRDKFDRALEDKELNKVYLFALPTAIGKTELLTNTTATIAAPTNILKNEIQGRMKIESITAPDAIIFETPYLNNKMSYYYTIGLPKKAMAVIHDVSSEKNSNKYPQIDVDKANIYLDQLSQCTNSTNTVLTTHARALFTEFKHDTIIFDEDPLKTLIDIKQVEITDIIKLLYQSFSFSNDLTKIIHNLESSEAGMVLKTPSLTLDVEALIEKLSLFQLNSNIVSFFSSSLFYKDPYNKNVIHYVTKRNLPDNKKIIILSATLPIDIYKKLYGDRIEVIDIRNVKQKGEVIQYTKRSCSRSELKRYHESISSEVGDIPVITFMNYRKYFNNAVQNMYFGNCEGYDTLKGQNIAVVGTPHRNNVVYFLTAAILGEKLSPNELMMSLQKIEYNGFRFKFNCYSHPTLRSIQLSLIESDLIQAVGRARTLRTNAIVKIYSNFPLKMSSQYIY